MKCRREELWYFVAQITFFVHSSRIFTLRYVVAGLVHDFHRVDHHKYGIQLLH